MTELPMWTMLVAAGAIAVALLEYRRGGARSWAFAIPAAVMAGIVVWAAVLFPEPAWLGTRILLVVAAWAAALVLVGSFLEAAPRSARRAGEAALRGVGIRRDRRRPARRRTAPSAG